MTLIVEVWPEVQAKCRELEASKIRHCLVSFYMIKEPSGLVEPLLSLGFYVWPFGLLNHIETSSTVSNYYFYTLKISLTLAPLPPPPPPPPPPKKKKKKSVIVPGMDPGFL